MFFISAVSRLGGSVDSFPVLGLGSSLNKTKQKKKKENWKIKISIYWQLNSPDLFASSLSLSKTVETNPSVSPGTADELVKNLFN